MPVSSITCILLRLFALNWFLAGIISLASMAYVRLNPNAFGLVIPSIVQILAGVVLWFLAPWISRFASKGKDVTASLEGVSEEQLFAAVFVGLGTFFSLKSFASVFNWIHFFAINKSPEYGFHKESAPSFYDLTEQGLTFAAGFFLVVSGKRWAAKLAGHRTGERDRAPDDGRQDKPASSHARADLRQGSEVPTLADTFLTLPADLRKVVHLELCKQALRIWDDYCDRKGTIEYVETVAGTKQVVDRNLPSAAIRAVTTGNDAESVASRYREPIAAMQDDDLEFPDEIEFAYYSIYNLFGRYVGSRIDDDWRIVNQALAAHGEGSDYASMLAAAIDRSDGPRGGGQVATRFEST